jgi:sugar phosphate isomerase/epimerase
MIRFGGPVFWKQTRAAGSDESHGAAADDPVLLAKAHRAKGYTAGFAPPVDRRDTARVAAIREAFAAEGVLIAEVGYWENLVDTDPETRQYHRQQMVETLALADALGARCAVDIFGSYCHGHGSSQHVPANFSTDAFDEAVQMARYFLDTVQPQTACFAYEIFPFNMVDSPQMIARLIQAVDRPKFGVHLDLVNLINSPRAYWGSGDIMRECVRLFGDRIVAAHLKDIRMQAPAISVLLEEVVAGQGGLDMATYVRELHRLPHDVPALMEHLPSEAEYDQAAAYIREVAVAEGIAL